MKKLFLVAAFVMGTLTLTTSCGSMGGMNGGTLQTISKVANVAQTAEQIANVLGINLGLSNNQQSSITGILSSFIGKSNNIASLAGTDKEEYGKKLGNISKNALGKINNVLDGQQYASLLGLVTKGSKGSIADNLKGGNDLSSDAISVLSGLLKNGLR